MKKTLLFVITIFILMSCENIMTENPVPNAPVSLYINIMQNAPILNVPGGYLSIRDTVIAGQRMQLVSQGGTMETIEQFKYGESIGFGGVVVFHTFDDHFAAFDLCCPNELKRTTVVVPNMAGNAVCPVCETIYDIGFGTGFVSSGVSKFPLKPYTVFVSGYNLRVVK
jgi:hypothetical protein